MGAAFDKFASMVLEAMGEMEKDAASKALTSAMASLGGKRTREIQKNVRGNVAAMDKAAPRSVGENIAAARAGSSSFQTPGAINRKAMFREGVKRRMQTMGAPSAASAPAARPPLARPAPAPGAPTPAVIRPGSSLARPPAPAAAVAAPKPLPPAPAPAAGTAPVTQSNQAAVSAAAAPPAAPPAKRSTKKRRTSKSDAPATQETQKPTAGVTPWSGGHVAAGVGAGMLLPNVLGGGGRDRDR